MRVRNARFEGITMAGPTIDFWQERFEQSDTPWDRGAANPQLAAWLPEIRPGRRIVVPGCGSGWEVAELAKAGAVVTGLDYAPAAIDKARALLEQRVLFAEIVQADVLEWYPPSPVDAIYEQTCLCALHPDHWMRYAEQLHAWLKPGGRLYAMFMQRESPAAASGRIEGPPFHCNINAMRALLPSSMWEWPKPPYAVSPHPSGWFELAAVLVRR